MSVAIPRASTVIDFEEVAAPVALDNARTYRAHLSPDLVYFAGHFPSFALLPAVAQIAKIVLPLARRDFAGLGAVHRLRRVRFRRPIAPGTTITVALTRTGQRVVFEIRDGAEVASSGTVEFHPLAEGAPER